MSTSNSSVYSIFTAVSKPKRSGDPARWGAVIIPPNGEPFDIPGTLPDEAATHPRLTQRMRLIAAIEALRAIPPGSQVTLNVTGGFARAISRARGDRFSRSHPEVDLWDQLREEALRCASFTVAKTKATDSTRVRARANARARDRSPHVPASRLRARSPKGPALAPQEHPPAYTVHTDGSASPNPGPGGYAAIIQAPDGALQELTGADPQSTNNRCELLAVIIALEAIPRDSTVRVFTDSTYVANGAKRVLLSGVRLAKPNPDLWQRFRDAALPLYSVQCLWVRGHAGNVRNERCDKLANEARKRGLPSASSTNAHTDGKAAQL